jgi:hypothetical protein
LKNIKTLKILFIFLSTLMIASIWFGVLTEDAMKLQVSDRVIAGVFGSLVVLGINYVIYKLLAKIWK